MSEADYTIHTNLEQAYQIDLDALHLAAWHALRMAEAQAPVALTITITTTERVQEFNRQYAGLDEPTDVLAFASGEEPHATEPGEPPYLGDVVIAYPVAEEQAQMAGIPVLAELQLLAIHGTLHLLGYDHDTPPRQAKMWALQSAAMDKVRAKKDS